MKHSIYKLALTLGLLSLCACSTADKYATGRFYEIYSVSGLGACEFKPKFNDCAEQRVFDIKISDNKEKIAIAKYINPSDEVSFFGFIRNDYPAQVKPIRDFLLWAQADTNTAKHLTMKRPAGNAHGYLFENSEVEYQFDFTQTRAGVPILVIHIDGKDRYFGLTIEQAQKLLTTLDAWYENRAVGYKLT